MPATTPRNARRVERPVLAGQCRPQQGVKIIGGHRVRRLRSRQLSRFEQTGFGFQFPEELLLNGQLVVLEVHNKAFFPEIIRYKLDKVSLVINNKDVRWCTHIILIALSSIVMQ